MSEVIIRNKQLWKDGVVVPITGAEVHYWRLEPAYWRTVLQRAIDMGIKTVSSYVQWHFHEIDVGRFDFLGETDPKRNIVQFIELIMSMGLNLIIRPGPYTFAEWNNYGLPDYVLPYHRLHPKFLEAASRYLVTVCELIRPYLATNGGPIIMVQADNMFDLGIKRYDRQLGLYGGDGIFQEYLRKKYGDIDSLNRAWGSDYKSFFQVMATMARPCQDDMMQIRWLDFQEFKYWFTSEAAKWTVSQLRRNSIDVPIYSNATKDQNLVEMSKILDILAFNHYPTVDYSLVTDEHRHLLDHVRLLSVLSSVPYIAEIESGIWHGYHYTKGLPTKSHYRYMLLTVLAGGAVSWTWYMFHDRDNWYMSPLNSKGLKREEVFSCFKQFVELVTSIKPYSWERCSNTALTYYPLHFEDTFSELEYSSLDASGVLYDIGIDYYFYSMQSPNQVPKLPKLLIYNGKHWLDPEYQEVLLDYMNWGGHLVVFAKYPYLDQSFRPCNLLKIPLPDGVESQGYMNTFYKDLEVRLGGMTAHVNLPPFVYVYHEVPGVPIRATHRVPDNFLNDNVLEEYQLMVNQGVGEEITIGYNLEWGKGSLTVLGILPSPELIVSLHTYLDVDIPARPNTPGIQAVLHKEGNLHYLFVLNNSFETKSTGIFLSKTEFPNGKYRIRNLLDNHEYHIHFEADTLRLLSVLVDKKNGVLLEIQPT